MQTNGEKVFIHSPSELPPVNKMAEIREPIIIGNILVPQDYVGNVITLCIEKRGVQKNMQYKGKRQLPDL